jgi:hypothetical protein
MPTTRSRRAGKSIAAALRYVVTGTVLLVFLLYVGIEMIGVRQSIAPPLNGSLFELPLSDCTGARASTGPLDQIVVDAHYALSGIDVSWRAPTRPVDCTVFYGLREKPIAVRGAVTSIEATLAIFNLTKHEIGKHVIAVETYFATKLVGRGVRGLPCPDVAFLAARGSGQNSEFLVNSAAFGQGLGDRGLRVFHRIASGLSRQRMTIDGQGVDYPAIKVGLDTRGIALGNGLAEYASSARDGVTDGARKVARIVQSCPATKIILFGYSQGGQVMGDVFQQLPINDRNHVSRVILFADAAYRSGDPAVHYRPTDAGGRGVKGQRPRFPRSTTVIESWCWNQDTVCHVDQPFFHFHGDIYDGYENLAADAAVATLTGSAPS